METRPELEGPGRPARQPAPPAAGRGAPCPSPDPWKRVKRIFFRALILVSVLLVLGVIAAVLVIAHFEEGLPSVEQLKKGYAPPQVTRILARDGTVLADLFTERRTVIPFAEIPAHAKLAFLAAEDASFYEHEGLNYLGILRALLANLRSGATRQGGSTITQQVVKNVLLDSERTYKRKIRETILARRLEQYLTKDEILGLYLNHIYLGHGRYGIEEAARYYFGKRARALELSESALLAGLVASPEHFSPRKSPERALERRRYVLGQMLEKGFVDRALHDSVIEAPLRLAPASEAESELCPEGVEAARKVLDTVASSSKGGFEVTTTIVPGLQAAARKAVREGLDAYATRHYLRPPFTALPRSGWGKPLSGRPSVHRVVVGTVTATDDKLDTIDVKVGDVTGRIFLAQESRYNPGGLSPSQFTTPGALLRVSLLSSPESGELPPLRLELGPEAALVAIDVRTREILALVGSYEAVPGGLDRGTLARRQPGSSFKPFVYGYALHARQITPATVLELAPAPGSPPDAPSRRVAVRDAVARSDNAAAVRVLRDAGAPAVVAFAHALGIESNLGATDSLALGAYEVTPLEITNAFATFASGGEVANATLLSRIQGPGGREVPLPSHPPPRRVLEADEAYLVTSLLRSVVTYGTGRRAEALHRAVAGKTGTTNQAKDAWFVGYSTDIVCGVWVGYDDALPLGSGESGGSTALPIWVSFMKAAVADKPATEFSRPGTIVTARIDPETGLLPRPGAEDRAVEEEFLDGTVPTEAAPAASATAPVVIPVPADAGPTDQPPF